MAGCGDDVAAWLDKLGLAEYTDKFLSAGYSSLKQCFSLSEEDLSAIGVVKVGHINRLFRDLKRMKADGKEEWSIPHLPHNQISFEDDERPPPVPPRTTSIHRSKPSESHHKGNNPLSPKEVCSSDSKSEKSENLLVVKTASAQRDNLCNTSLSKHQCALGLNSSEDECNTGTKIISQPSLEENSAALSSVFKSVPHNDTNEKDNTDSSSTSITVVPQSLMQESIQMLASSQPKQRLVTKATSLPLLSSPLSMPSPGQTLPAVSITKSASCDAVHYMIPNETSAGMQNHTRLLPSEAATQQV